MSRKIFYVCDQCGAMFKIPGRGGQFLHIICGNDTPSYPHGEFCSVECTIQYLEKWKRECHESKEVQG